MLSVERDTPKELKWVEIHNHRSNHTAFVLCQGAAGAGSCQPAPSAVMLALGTGNLECQLKAYGWVNGVCGFLHSDVVEDFVRYEYFICLEASIPNFFFCYPACLGSVATNGNKTTHLGMSVLPWRGCYVGIRADGWGGIQIICADVVKSVTEATANRAAVIPAAEKGAHLLYIRVSIGRKHLKINRCDYLFFKCFTRKFSVIFSKVQWILLFRLLN